MPFNATLKMEKNGLAKITLDGELDASAAPAFKSVIEEAAAQQAQRLVLLMANLSYMASAGLRALVFARQKMGPTVDIFIISAQESVLETIQITGFHHSVILLDQYDATQVETI